jgi:hypothetical protein
LCYCFTYRSEEKGGKKGKKSKLELIAEALHFEESE